MLMLKHKSDIDTVLICLLNLPLNATKKLKVRKITQNERLKINVKKTTLRICQEQYGRWLFPKV